MKKILLLIFFTISLMASQKPLQKVSLQLMWLDQFQFAGYYMAKEKGFFKEKGFDVELKKFNYETNVVNEVLSRRATYGVGRSSLIKLFSDGRELVLISAIFQSSPFVLISLKSSNINSIDDFKNKKFMLTTDAVETASIHAMISSKKLQEKDLTFKRHTFDLEELIDGRVDLYAAYTSNEPYYLKQRNIAYKIFSPKEEGFDFYSDLLFTSQYELKHHPKRVAHFREATLKGWKYAFNHIEESVDLIYKKYNSQHKTKDALLFEAKVLKRLAYIDSINLGQIDKSRIARIFDVYKIMGVASGNIDLDKLIFNTQESLLNPNEKQYIKNKKEINICVLPNSLPYSAIKNGKYVGIGSEILSLINKKIHLKYNLIQTKTWAESIKRGENKECDLLPIASSTTSQKKSFNFTSPYHHEPLVIVTNKKNNYILDFQSVIDKTFSIVKGHPFIEYIVAKYPDVKLREVKTTQEGLDGVERGEFYGHIDVLMAAAYALKYMDSNDLRISGEFEDKVAVSFAIRKDDKVLFDIFEKISTNIKPAELQKLLNSWVKIKYVENINFKYKLEIFSTILLLIILLSYRQYILKKHNQELEKKVSKAIDEAIKKDAYLLQQSRLVQMGEMLSMIAHQWKQPLASISIAFISIKVILELEKYDLNDEKEREEFLLFLDTKLQKIEFYTNSLSKTISDFSDFYQPNKKLEVLELDTIVSKSKTIFSELLKAADIEVILDLDATCEINAHENELMQTILNIVNNAKEQLINKKIKGAKIWIKTYNTQDDAFIEISDNAGGIPNDIIDKIFDPYFSTKLNKNGTGLGLYMSKTIIKDYHDGDIYVKNIDDGVVFTIKIKRVSLKDNDEQN